MMLKVGFGFAPFLTHGSVITNIPSITAQMHGKVVVEQFNSVTIVGQNLSGRGSIDEQLEYFLRLNIPLLVSQTDGSDTQQMADLYGLNRTTIGRWVTKVNNSMGSDITVLQRVPKPGRNTPVSDDLLVVLKKVLAESPKNVGLEAEWWMGNLLSEYLACKYDKASRPMCRFRFSGLHQQ